MSSTSAERPRTEVFVIESSPVVAFALRAHRPGEESTYLLCRAAGERGADFNRRVLKRARQIQAKRSIGSLWYVVGSNCSDPAGSVKLLQDLLPLLESGGQVTLAASRSLGHVALAWLDALLGCRAGHVNMGVRFYPDSLELRRSAALNTGSEQALLQQQQCA